MFASTYPGHTSLRRRDQHYLEVVMLYWAAVFLVIAIIAGIMGMGGIAGVSSSIAWVLFVVFLVLFVLSLVFGGLRKGGPTV